MDVEQAPNPGTKNASWGAVISMVVILAMIVIGAFYSWEKRVREEHALQSSLASTTQNQ
ncbi:MAG: hypothetical protein P4M11_06245 [Candidatus Pacebacteria bacterium]|nr:hypothetical protein [Candidatus Paceibacterota bacterium]